MKRDEADALREILRRGDPAADGSKPTPAELARMRDRILQAGARERILQAGMRDRILQAGARDRILRTGAADELGGRGAGETPWYRSPRRTLTVTVVAAVLAVALGAEFWLRRAAVDASRSAGTASARQALSAEPAPPAATGRQIHFTTPGGTRIVWVLYPPANAAGHSLDTTDTADTTWDRADRGPGGS